MNNKIIRRLMALPLLLVLFSLNAQAQCSGPGPCVAGTINRASLSDTYPIVQANNLGGGLKSVSTASQLSTLINVNSGDLATTQDTLLIYQWTGSAWIPYPPQGYLIQWFLNQTLTLVSASRDSNYAVTTASIIWPDGSTGTFTTDSASTACPGAIDAYHITYVAPTGNHTVTQAAVTRNTSTCLVTFQPTPTVS